MTFFDTAEAYGPFTNEELVGEALATLPRQGRRRDEVRHEARRTAPESGGYGSSRTMKANSEYPFWLPRWVPFMRTYRAEVLAKVTSVTEYEAPVVVL